MKVSEGGGNRDEGEYIEIIEMGLPEAKSLIFNESLPRPLSLIFSLMWFFDHKLKMTQKL